MTERKKTYSASEVQDLIFSVTGQYTGGLEGTFSEQEVQEIIDISLKSISISKQKEERNYRT